MYSRRPSVHICEDVISANKTVQRHAKKLLKSQHRNGMWFNFFTAGEADKEHRQAVRRCFQTFLSDKNHAVISAEDRHFEIPKNYRHILDQRENTPDSPRHRQPELYIYITGQYTAEAYQLIENLKKDKLLNAKEAKSMTAFVIENLLTQGVMPLSQMISPQGKLYMPKNISLSGVLHAQIDHQIIDADALLRLHADGLISDNQYLLACKHYSCRKEQWDLAESHERRFPDEFRSGTNILPPGLLAEFGGDADKAREFLEGRGR
jgi:hypothetical protein